MSEYYCDIAKIDPVHTAYHDKEYGFPNQDERILMERLALEIMQAGLNWGLVLKKREGLNKAFDDFAIDRLIAYDDEDKMRLLNDAAIIRNRLKINAILENAKVIYKMRESHAGFANWLKAHHPLTKADWVKLFKKNFKFTGGEITGEFLMSLGYLPPPHRMDCPTYQKILTYNPPFLSAGENFYNA